MTKSAESPGFQTQSQLRARLEAAGLSPRRMFGQNFLVDRNLMMKLVDAASLTPHDTILEVGGGTGSLTALLAERVGHVVTVEIDRGLFPLLQETIQPYANVTLLRCDALARKSAVEPEVLDVLGRHGPSPAGALKLVANLPYDIATSLVVNLLIGDFPFDRFCFTVQTEVADRFLAEPDTADYGPVSVVSQSLTEGRRICKAPAEAFWPRPKVHSSMVDLKVKPNAPLAPGRAHAFAEFVRSFFQHRRQMIGKIARGVANAEAVVDACKSMDIDLTARPATLAPEQWLRVFLALH
ncbi:MAG: ribosomal RNA small subunit methyltransferase A [Planctomycetes bacterium]|nr:ribosomal RNA small subunit methyltransferase A [Planctomycetota bacterium]